MPPCAAAQQVLPASPLWLPNTKARQASGSRLLDITTNLSHFGGEHNAAKRKHLTPQWYKKVTAMDAKLEQLESTLNGINFLNAGKKREEAVAQLAELLPQIESFQAETQRLLDTIAISQQERQLQQWKNDVLRDELNEERERNYKQHMQISELQRRCKRAEKLLKKLPDEVLQRLKQERKGRER